MSYWTIRPPADHQSDRELRLRHRRTKGNASRTACLTMVFKLMQSAQKRWRLLNGLQLLHDVIQGIQFIDGIKSQETAA